MVQRMGSPAGVSRHNRIVGAAIVLLIALFCSCGHKANQSGVTRPESGVQTAVGAQGVAPLSDTAETPGGQPSAPTPNPQFAALQKYAASLPPVTGQVVEPVRFGDRQPDGTHILDGRKMTLGEILASAPKVACPPLMQIRLPDDWNKTSAGMKASGKTTSGLGEIFNPPQLPPPIPLPGGWNPGPIIGVNPPPPPPIFGGPPPPGHVPYEGEGIGPLYDPTPIVYQVMDGPPVDVAILHMGPYGVYGALAVLTRHTIQLFAGPNALGGMGSWTARITINLPTQVTTWAPDPADRHTVDGAYAVRLRVADMNNDGRDDIVVVMNWDDPAWPQGVNQFGYTGTWVYYQNWSGYFDEPFSPGGASREYDVTPCKAITDATSLPSSRSLPDLEGVQNPHISPTVYSYVEEIFADEFYDHRKFKDAGPLMQPVPHGSLWGDYWPGPGEFRYSSVEKTNADGDPLDDLVTPLQWVDSETGNVDNFLALFFDQPGTPLWVDRGSDYLTSTIGFRARPGRFEPNEAVDDYAVTFPSSNSLQIVHPSRSAAPYYAYSQAVFYTPQVLLPGMQAIGSPREVQVSDLNGDGLSDLVVLNDSRLYVLQNLGARTFIVTDEFPVQDGVQRAAVGPLFSGREKDMAVIDSPSSCVLVYRPIPK